MPAFKDHFSGHAEDYLRYRPEYPDQLFDWLAGAAPARSMAWDCAAGNGQATLGLARRFDVVVASDASERQLGLAPALDNVEYRVAPAEASGLAGDAFDLVTVAQALHWFDLDAFYAEVRRVLKPCGVLAVWTYSDVRAEGDAGAALREYCALVEPYWPPERSYVDDGYRSLDFPFDELEIPAFEMRADWTAAQLAGYAGTWSATKRCAAATGHDPVASLRRALEALWPQGEARPLRWRLWLRAGRC